LKSALKGQENLLVRVKRLWSLHSRVSFKRNSFLGDSGGPLVVTLNNIFYLIGATAGGDPNCAKNVASVFTKISAFINWIRRSKIHLCQSPVSCTCPVTPTNQLQVQVAQLDKKDAQFRQQFAQLQKQVTQLQQQVAKLQQKVDQL
jgi:secreted trypsin-like serine protease